MINVHITQNRTLDTPADVLLFSLNSGGGGKNPVKHVSSSGRSCIQIGPLFTTIA